MSFTVQKSEPPHYQPPRSDMHFTKCSLNLFHAIKPDPFQFITPPPPHHSSDFPNKTDPAVCGCAPSVRHTAALRCAARRTGRPTGKKEKMSGIMLLSVSLALCLLWATGGSARSGAVILERGSVSLNDMFREVEELMEDTQHILEEAVDQITTETAKSSLTSLDLRLNYHNETRELMKDKTDKENKNKTGETQSSHNRMEISGNWNSLDHECMVDEDCGEMKYCLYEIENSKCLPCIPTDMPCTKDEECCSDQMCVWGQCTVNATRGTEGTICQGQSDCRPHLCCAFLQELLFPVCSPRPEKGESCLSHPNLLMDMLAWDQEGPRDHCPCADDLQCQPHGRGSVCGE